MAMDVKMEVNTANMEQSKMKDHPVTMHEYNCQFLVAKRQSVAPQLDEASVRRHARSSSSNHFEAQFLEQFGEEIDA